VNELVFFVNKVVVTGAVIGGIYALGAVGVTLVFAILRFAHFAHGDLMTVGAFVSLLAAPVARSLGLDLGLPAGFLVLPVAMLATAALAIALDHVFYKPLRERGAVPVVLVMASIGVTLMLQGLVRLFAGTSPRSFFAEETKEIYRLELPFDLARRAIVVTEPQVLLVGFTVAAVVALHLFLTRSRLGKAMRAMSDNPDLARVSGIDTRLVIWTTWAIAGGLAAGAGTLLSLDVTLKPDLSFGLLLPIFAAAIVGGVGKPYGAVAGGLLVGFAETLSVFNWSVLLRPVARLAPDAFDVPARIAFVPTEYKVVVPFFILVVVLIWRPTGIFRGQVN
jgi:branched-chain amino acid transport system permease protein